MKKKPEPNNRHPQAVAWDEWAESNGKGCLVYETLTPGPYLENRLREAFIAGWEAAKREARAMRNTCPHCGRRLRNAANLIWQLRERATWLEDNYPSRETIELLRRAADEIERLNNQS